MAALKELFVSDGDYKTYVRPFLDNTLKEFNIQFD